MNLRIKKYKALLISFFLVTLFLPSYLISEESATELALDQNIIAYQTSPSLMISTGNSKKRDRAGTRKIHFRQNADFEKAPSYFANINYGMGFIYFNKFIGSFSLVTNSARIKTKSLQTRFVYNPTPLLEGSLAWSFTSGCKKLSFIGLGLSFLHQGSIDIQSYNVTQTVPAQSTATNLLLYIFSATIDLNAIVGKFYFYFPFSLIYKPVAYSPYLALSAGPSWQTWSNIKIYDKSTDVITQFTQVISANIFYSGEAGIKVRSVHPNVSISGVLGCKFSIWGQARQMGGADTQKLRNPAANNGTARAYALDQPWSVKTVYQLAPFIGIIWSY